MPSPFPGMDPYLEDPSRWPDVHQRLITYTADALQPHLRPRYHARIGERVYVVSPPQTMYPDVVLTHRPLRETAQVRLTRAVEPAATDLGRDIPIILTVAPVEMREPFDEIVQSPSQEVVAIIEVLSPANKAPGKGHERYGRKQREILGSSSHLIEIDLLSSGLHTVAIPEEALSALPPHRYLLCTSRAPERFRFEAYPIALQDCLPLVRIPLRQPDPDVVLDLQDVFTQCYDNGDYSDLINYGEPPPAPPLAGREELR